MYFNKLAYFQRSFKRKFTEYRVKTLLVGILARRAFIAKTSLYVDFARSNVTGVLLPEKAVKKKKNTYTHVPGLRNIVRR